MSIQGKLKYSSFKRTPKKSSLQGFIAKNCLLCALLLGWQKRAVISGGSLPVDSVLTVILSSLSSRGEPSFFQEMVGSGWPRGGWHSITAGAPTATMTSEGFCLKSSRSTVGTRLNHHTQWWNMQSLSPSCSKSDIYQNIFPLRAISIQLEEFISITGICWLGKVLAP